MRKKFVTFTTAAVAVALLAGCSSGGSGSGSGSGPASSGGATAAAKTTEAAAPQTKEEACAQIEGDFQEFLKDQSSSSASADPRDRARVVDELTARFDDVLPTIGNADVKTAFTHFSADAKEFAAAVEKTGKLDSPEAQAAQAKVQTSLAEVSAVCPA